MSALSLEQVRSLLDAGAIIVDLRTPRAFLREHPTRAVTLQFHRRNLPKRARQVLPAGSTLVLLVEPELLAPDAQEVLQQASFVVPGWIRGGLAGWKRAGGRTASVPVLSASDLKGDLERGALDLVDVREEYEYSWSHIGGARHVPLGRVWEMAPGLGLRPNVAVMCATQNRSSTAVSVLLHRGRPESFAVVWGGMEGWSEAGYPVVRPAGAGSAEG